jgi:hypothetical protein
MLKRLLILLSGSLVALLLASAGGCGCGFGCNNDNDDDSGPAILSLGFSGESLEELKQVVIEVDRITLQRTGGEQVLVETFTIDELGLTEADTFQIDLLQYRGLNQLTVIDGLELEPGGYSSIAIGILGGDVNRSYVQDRDDILREINVPGDTLSLPGIVPASGAQRYTAVFSLPQALRYRAATDDYRLTDTGARVVDNGVAASLSGRVDTGLFDSVTPCDEKTDPESGNTIYLYRGTDLSATALADVHTGDSGPEIPDGALAPFAVATLARDVLTGRWQYALGFLPSGEYTLAFACDSADDDPVDFDAIVIPLPEDQQYDIQLDEGEQAVCDLADSATCS